GTLEVRNDATFAYDQGPSPLFRNAGTLRKVNGTGVTTFAEGTTFTNTGTVQVRTGTLSLAGVFTNFFAPTDTLALGTYEVTGTLQFAGARIVTNLATLTLDGPVARVLDLANADALAPFAANGPAGAFALQGGRNFTFPGAFTNSGTLAVGPGSVLTFAGPYTQTGGGLTGPGTAAVGGLLTWTGGTMSGAGQTRAEGGLSLSGPLDRILLERSFWNAGAAVWSGGGDLVLGDGARFTNSAGAVFDMQGDARAAHGGGEA